MGFRVYDKKKKKFVQDSIYLTPDGELVEPKKSLFGDKLTFVDQNRYAYQKAIELNDRDGNAIYMGDYLEAQISDDETITGLVTFSTELSSYIILCFDNDKYYNIGDYVSDRIKIVGNVFDEFYE